MWLSRGPDAMARERRSAERWARGSFAMAVVVAVETMFPLWAGMVWWTLLCVAGLVAFLAMGWRERRRAASLLVLERVARAGIFRT